MNIKPNHPLAEQIASHLHGIERVPHREAGRMVNRASREAAKWHEAEIERLRAEIVRLQIKVVERDAEIEQHAARGEVES